MKQKIIGALILVTVFTPRFTNNVGASRNKRTLTSSVVSNVQTSPGKEKPVTTQGSANLHQFISELYKAAYPEEVAPGIAVVVVKDDQVVYFEGFGYADLEAKRKVTPRTVFYIASATKPFVGLSAALLNEDKKIDLDAPLSRYLPTLRLQPPLSPDAITLRDLFTHTHGLDPVGPVVFRTAFSGEFTPDLLISLLAKYKPAESGRAFRYGNIGYNVASLAMDAALKESWKDVLQRKVLKPLRMTSTTAYLSKVDPKRLAMPYFMGEKGYVRVPYVKRDANMHAAGGLVSTAGDLAKWLEVNINRGRVGGKQVFPAAVVEETRRKYAEQQRDFAGVKRHGYGLGWNLGTYDGDTLVHHHGGFSASYAHVSFMPERRIGVAVLAHEGTLGGRLAETIAQYVYDTLLAKPTARQKWTKMLTEAPHMVRQGLAEVASQNARRAARQRPLSHALEAYVGTYDSPEGGRMKWSVVNGRLEASISLLRSVAEVYDASSEALRVELVPGQGEVVRFIFSENHNQAERLEYFGMRFERIKQ